MLTAAPCERATRPCARIAPAPTCTSPRISGAGDLRLGLVDEHLVEAHSVLTVLLAVRATRLMSLG
jgi:hypothetical protein